MSTIGSPHGTMSRSENYGVLELKLEEKSEAIRILTEIAGHSRVVQRRTRMNDFDGIRGGHIGRERFDVHDVRIDAMGQNRK